MNEFHFSELEIVEKFGAYQTLGEVITEIETQSKSKDAVVCEIKVNGLLFHEEDEKCYGETSVTDIKTLSFKTQNVDHLVVESICSLLNYLSKLTDSVIQTSEKLRLGQWEEAHKNLNAVVAGTEWVVDMLSQIRIVDKKASLLDLDWKALDVEFLGATRGLLDAFEKSDYVLVADLLEYDWSNSLEKWLSLVNKLASLHIEENESTIAEANTKKDTV